MKTLPKDAPALFEAIAAANLGVLDLKTRNSDRLDFVECHVESIRTALELAYRAGMDAEAEKRTTRGLRLGRTRGQVIELFQGGPIPLSTPPVARSASPSRTTPMPSTKPTTNQTETRRRKPC